MTLVSLIMQCESRSGKDCINFMCASLSEGHKKTFLQRVDSATKRLLWGITKNKPSSATPCLAATGRKVE
jgi:hypothetical protein